MMASLLAGCGNPGYTYAADRNDKAYFKVPTNWREVDPSFVAEVQATLLGKSAAGSEGGRIAWTRAYTSALDPSALSLLTASGQPMVYATVQDLHDSLRAQLSFDLMRNLLFPVTPDARQQATSNGAKLSGFSLILNSTITTKYNMRGINELFLYTINGQADAFDQTVLTNSDTSKLYLLLVQCSQTCFLAHKTQIATIVQSFTVEGS
jgi:hypothetical protein